MNFLDKDPNETSKEFIYRKLRNSIISLDIKPGTIISENELVKQTNISRTPIRDILKRLENEHLIEIIPQTGSRVTYIDKSMISESLFMRFALEKEIIRTLQNTITKEEIIILENNISLQEFYHKKGLVVDFHLTDVEFHKTMFCLCNKSMVWKYIQMASIHYDRVRFMRILYGNNSNVNEIISEHTQLLNAIKNKDSYNYIEAILREHFMNPMEEFLSFFEKLGFKDYFI
jgi:DNA-binding GntR family transcriptional regulator